MLRQKAYMAGLFLAILRSWRRQLGLNAPAMQGINTVLCREAKMRVGCAKHLQAFHLGKKEGQAMLRSLLSPGVVARPFHSGLLNLGKVFFGVTVVSRAPEDSILGQGHEGADWIRTDGAETSHKTRKFRACVHISRAAHDVAQRFGQGHAYYTFELPMARRLPRGATRVRHPRYDGRRCLAYGGSRRNSDPSLPVTGSLQR